MAERMIRKQLYIERRQEEKLRRLASVRGCTEAELIRQAIDVLPEQEDQALVLLRRGGLVIESDEPRPDDRELAQRERAWSEVLDRSGAVDLADAVLKDREERDASLRGHIGDGKEVRSRGGKR